MLNSGYTCYSSVGSLGLLLVNCKNSTLASTDWCRGPCLCLCRSLSLCSPSTRTSPIRSLYLYCRLGCWGCRLLSTLLRANSWIYALLAHTSSKLWRNIYIDHCALFHTLYTQVSLNLVLLQVLIAPRYLVTVLSFGPLYFGYER